MSTKLLVGLGNPGDKYKNTRHNIGFMLLDILTPNTNWETWKDLGLWKEVNGVHLVKPHTMMNDSGRMVYDFATVAGIKPEEMLICYDDLAFDLGSLRIKERGSCGGHNGMRSIIDILHTDSIPRLRLGIGPKPSKMTMLDFVLEDFQPKDKTSLEQVLNKGTLAIKEILSVSLPSAMNKFNV